MLKAMYKEEVVLFLLLEGDLTKVVRPIPFGKKTVFLCDLGCTLSRIPFWLPTSCVHGQVLSLALLTFPQLPLFFLPVLSVFCLTNEKASLMKAGALLVRSASVTPGSRTVLGSYEGHDYWNE